MICEEERRRRSSAVREGAQRAAGRDYALCAVSRGD